MKVSKTPLFWRQSFHKFLRLSLSLYYSVSTAELRVQACTCIPPPPVGCGTGIEPRSSHLNPEDLTECFYISLKLSPYYLWTSSVGEVHNQENLSSISKTHLKRLSIVVCTCNPTLGRWRQAEEGPCALPS